MRFPIRIVSGINDPIGAKSILMANIFLHRIDVPLRFTPGGEKRVEPVEKVNVT